MVALEPDKHLLPYITATTEVVSMVLVAEQPEPHNLKH
jgi:cation transporter-like permease